MKSNGNLHPAAVTLIFIGAFLVIGYFCYLVMQGDITQEDLDNWSGKTSYMDRCYAAGHSEFDCMERWEEKQDRERRRFDD